MSNLLIKPNNDSKIKFDITPETAHWDYVGFKLYHLKKGDNIKEKTNLEESILVFVEGYGDIEVSGKKLGKLGTRNSVFEKNLHQVFISPYKQSGLLVQVPI